MIVKRGFSKAMQQKDQGLNKKERGLKRKHDSELKEKEEPIQFCLDESGFWVVNKKKNEPTEILKEQTPEKESFDKDAFLAEIREAIRLRNLNLGT